MQREFYIHPHDDGKSAVNEDGSDVMREFPNLVAAIMFVQQEAAGGAARVRVYDPMGRVKLTYVL